MDPKKVSAEFAAYAWYTETKKGTATQADALQFAEENWRRFLPYAHEGWGRLLIRLSEGRPNGARRQRHAGRVGNGPQRVREVVGSE